MNSFSVPTSTALRASSAADVSAIAAVAVTVAMSESNGWGFERLLRWLSGSLPRKEKQEKRGQREPLELAFVGKRSLLP